MKNNRGFYKQQIGTQSTNRLDGLTILRFSHAFSSGGGVEQYLDDLDNALLARNSVSIIKMFLSQNDENKRKTVQKIGQGTIVKFPMRTRVLQGSMKGTEAARFQKFVEIVKSNVRDKIFYNPLLYRVLFKRIIKMRPINRSSFEASNICYEINEIFSDYKVDLVVMHDIGKRDSFQLITETRKIGIPFVVVNHYSNDRLNHLSIREQTKEASGIAGVTGIGVPKRLRNIFVNLADGIDTNFFSKDSARPVNQALMAPVVLLPARITPSKGQSDLIEAISILRKEGINVCVALAGRTDSVQYEKEIKHKIWKLGLQKYVLFLGQLKTEELRDWYNVSSIMAFPTYHHEGLPRILMETQAMQVPPIAYIIGGIPEGIIHEKTGFLIPKGDIQGLAKSAKELLTNEEKRKKMGEEGRKFVKKQFSLQALATRHEEFYLRFLDNC